jgi:3-phenylpropionate/trans-cinnamate dioxygenase ferredoxin reductase component
MKNGIIIIGSGHAGGIAAITLRQKKYPGPILIIGQEKFYPYQRPALSKGFLTNEIKENSLYLKSPEWYKKQNIDLILNNSVKSINCFNKVIHLSDKRQYRYDHLIIATGSILNKIQLSCNESNIHYLRTMEDSKNIRKDLITSKNIVVIGAGYIGLEIASSAIKKNMKVTVIEMEDRVMNRSISQDTSDFLKKKHENNGVNFLLNTAIIDITDYKKQKKITCNNRQVIYADSVILGVGVKPNIQLALDAGLNCKDGISVSEKGLTSDKYIYAAGDCTNHPNNIYNRRIRLESVHNAVEQGKLVASSIIGNAKPYHQVPWFWSDQYNLKIQIAGLFESYDEIVTRGNKQDERFSLFYLKEKKVIAVETINSSKDFLAGKYLINLGAKIDKKIIENKDIDLKKMFSQT